MMMKSIAQEVAPWRIRVNAISPGAIRTPINMEAWQTAEAYAALMKLVPYKRIGETDDIARAAVWLASDDSDYITGATLYVTHFPCSQCAAFIVQAGIKQVVTRPPAPAFFERWKGDIEEAERIFRDAGVVVHALTN